MREKDKAHILGIKPNYLSMIKSGRSVSYPLALTLYKMFGGSVEIWKKSTYHEISSALEYKNNTTTESVK